MATNSYTLANGTVVSFDDHLYGPELTKLLTALTSVPASASPADGAANVPSLRTLGTTGVQACAGNDSRLTQASDAAAGVASLRTLGTGATQACAGNDSRLTPASDAAAGTPSLRSLGTGATQACAGNDSRLTQASDAAAGVASLRTLGTGATQACAGNDSRLTQVSDGAANVASLRTLGTGATQAAAGNDSRFSTPAGATATPTANAVVQANASGQIATGWLPLGSAAAVVKWDKESTTTPSVGAFTTFSEGGGITSPTYTVDSTSGNALKITQSAGDSGWGKRLGVYTGSISSADYSVRANFRMTAAATSKGCRFGVAARSAWTGSVLNGYVFQILGDDVNAYLYLTKYTAGVGTNLKSNLSLITVSSWLGSGDQMQMQLDVYGGWLTCRLNGILIWRVYDTTYSSAGIAAVVNTPTNTGTQSQALFDYFDVIPHTDPFFQG